MKEPETQHTLLISDTRGKRKVVLGASRYTIGRQTDNTIQIYSKFVSKYHAALLRIPKGEGGKYIYRILDGSIDGKPSVNGVTINKQTKVSSYDLQHGDIITLAPDVEMKYLVLTPDTLEEDEWIGFESLQEFSPSSNTSSSNTAVSP
ncbi:MAG: FHA domain-containing protein [Pseudanabaenaceae cyanobacterium SKYGB_i_bin29]|nr:FHA domain-containing protein [Pseudanabaenaceae cyanobacterium SKYG29]MDW8420741.1 FHA domain-containing protein [Pseudanabaenaceae cyanobacterium SKYGB_i_bin29]